MFPRTLFLLAGALSGRSRRAFRAAAGCEQPSGAENGQHFTSKSKRGVLVLSFHFNNLDAIRSRFGLLIIVTIIRHAPRGYGRAPGEVG